MVSEKFRRQLRQESEQWWAEGMIDAALYEKLADRYQFQHLEREASSRFVAILMGLGAVLLGLGAITFVAANWQEWSRSFKVIVLLSCFIGVNAVGFHLWRRPTSQKGQQWLGQALLLLGAMLLGANMGLMSQMFHQTGELYELFLVWGLGVAAMAYSLRLTSLSVLALILVNLGYSGGWFNWQLWEQFSWTSLLVQHMPLVTSIGFVPLAYWCRSRVIFGLSAMTIATSLIFNLKPLSSGIVTSGWLPAIAFGVPIALLWAYSDRLWQRLSTSLTATPALASRTVTTDPFQSIARSLSIWVLGIVGYLLSFRWLWEDYSGYRDGALANWHWQPLIDAVLLAIVAGLGWLHLSYQLRRDLLRVQEKAINSGTIALTLILMTIVFFCHSLLPGLGVLAFNLILFVLALGLIRDGLALASRHTFWGGMVLLVLGILSRMLEYDTGLLIKAIVFALCGVGVMAAGIWFERNIKADRPASLPTPSQE